MTPGVAKTWAPGDLVAWHDAECGGYRADLGLWLELAASQAGPVLDIGAGTGRVTVALARAGHRVTGLDRDPVLLAELEHRTAGLAVDSVTADARTFELGRRFALIIVPMQTIQLLDGPAERLGMLRSARSHLTDAGRVAIAISESLELYETEAGMPAPLPDILERDGIVYSSQPTAIRREAGGYLLVRDRERVGLKGERTAAQDRVRIAALSAPELEAETLEAGLRLGARRIVVPTPDHVGSTVVIARA